MAISIGESIPFPKYGLAWGKDMPPEVCQELKDSQITALVYKEGEPEFVLLWSLELDEWRQKDWAKFPPTDQELPEIIN